MRRGPLIAIEGIDGSGKGTQAQLLARALQARGLEVALFSFPAYQETLAGELIGAFLDGRMGSLRQIDSRLTAVLYALDRFELKGSLEQARERGAVVLCDRYVGSNLAHQAARTPASRRRALRAMIDRLEFGLFGLPRPDLVLYLDMPASLAQERVRQKAARGYTAKPLDELEADRAHLRLALADYRRQARTSKGWKLVSTAGRDGKPRSREAIHGDLLKELERRRLLGKA